MKPTHLPPRLVAILIATAIVACMFLVDCGTSPTEPRLDATLAQDATTSPTPTPTPGWDPCAPQHLHPTGACLGESWPTPTPSSEIKP